MGLPTLQLMVGGMILLFNKGIALAVIYTDTVLLDQIRNFSVLILAQSSGQGNAGNIEINTTNLVAKSNDKSSRSLLILTDHREGIGNSGDIIVNATDSISFDKTF